MLGYIDYLHHFYQQRSLHSLTLPILVLPHQLADHNSGQGGTVGSLLPPKHRGQCPLSWSLKAKCSLTGPRKDGLVLSAWCNQCIAF